MLRVHLRKQETELRSSRGSGLSGGCATIAGVEVLASAQACQLHTAHAPHAFTSEWHHVIPVAWQLHTPNPSSRPSPGRDPNGRGMLWDNRGVYICPTGHRNVHHFIVILTHAIVGESISIPEAWAKAISAGDKHRSEARCALDGLERAASCSVDFVALAAAGEWGQI